MHAPAEHPTVSCFWYTDEPTQNGKPIGPGWPQLLVSTAVMMLWHAAERVPGYAQVIA
jgi:hypothetical protein